MRGFVKWYDGAKGYGFIRPLGNERGRDIFFHYKDFIQIPNINLDGRVVEFEIRAEAKGPHATSVRLVEEVGESRASKI